MSEDWYVKAACHGEDLNTFFPVSGHTTRRAKEICQWCPVTAECLAYALSFEDPTTRFGVYGNTSPRERMGIPNSHAKPASPRRTECSNGHLFTGDNVIVQASGRRLCLTCKADQALRSECPHGHEYTEENVYINSKGARTCRTCTRERNRGARARAKGRA